MNEKPKYQVGDVFIPMNESWRKSYGTQRIQITKINYNGREIRYYCIWIGGTGGVYDYSESVLDKQQLDESTMAKRVLKSYE
jgi:hypothetical protein